MALLRKTLALFMVVTLFSLQVSRAAVYKVGDSAGWTTLGHIDYNHWANTKTFRVGDIIRFEYHSQIHNVMEVTLPMFKACNSSAPSVIYKTGNDSIPLTIKGHHYFLCGFPGHCQAGQKVDINVLSTTEMAPTPSALPTPGRSVNKAASLRDLNSLLGNLMGLAMIVFTVFASSAA